VDDYVAILFDEYAENSDNAVLLSSMRVMSRVKGISKIAEASDLSRKGVQKVLSENGNPQFGTVKAMLGAMSFRLAPQNLPNKSPKP